MIFIRKLSNNVFYITILIQRRAARRFASQIEELQSKLLQIEDEVSDERRSFAPESFSKN